MNAHIEILT